MKRSALSVGLMCIAWIIPLQVVFWLYCWLLILSGVGLLFLGEPSSILNVILVLPLFISPLMGIWGTVYGIIRRKEPKAWLGILLSLLTVAINFLIWALAVLRGSL